MKKTACSLLPLALALALAGAVWPASATPALAASRPAPTAIDADGDGTISRSEFDAAVRRRFDQIDGNGDQRITRSELRGFAMKQITVDNAEDPIFDRRRGRPDLRFDRDGSIDFAAFSREMGRSFFEPLDRDRDRVLSSVELRAAAR
jgi:hypothetical protein